MRHEFRELTHAGRQKDMSRERTAPRGRGLRVRHDLAVRETREQRFVRRFALSGEPQVPVRHSRFLGGPADVRGHLDRVGMRRVDDILRILRLERLAHPVRREPALTDLAQRVRLHDDLAVFGRDEADGRPARRIQALRELPSLARSRKDQDLSHARILSV